MPGNFVPGCSVATKWVLPEPDREIALGRAINGAYHHDGKHHLRSGKGNRSMTNQRSGVILSVTATPGGIGYPYTAGFAPACAALESFSRNLAAELGIYGVRVVNLRSGGSPDSQVFRQAFERNPQDMEMIFRGMENATMLKGEHGGVPGVRLCEQHHGSYD